MSSDILLCAIEKFMPFDIILVLSDGTNIINMDAHKIILLAQSVYFEKLLTNFVVRDSNNMLVLADHKTENICKIIINVSNAHICYDIFQSFYKRDTNVGEYPYWYHLLESFKCRDFFGLNIDQTLLSNLNIPPEGFEILIDVIDLLGYTDSNIKLINKFLPEGYDLSKFPKVLINTMIEYGMHDIVISSTRFNINAWNIQKRTLKTHVNENAVETVVACLCMSPNDKYLIVGYYDGTIQIRGSCTFKILKTFLCSDGNMLSNNKIVNIFFMMRSQKNRSDLDDEKMISCYESGRINMWNIETGKIINTFVDNDLLNDKIIYFVPSPNNNIIVYGTLNGKIKIFDAQTFTIIYIVYDGKIVNQRRIYKYCMCFSPDGKQMIFGNCHGKIEIWDINLVINDSLIFRPKLINTLSGHNSYVKDICFSNDETKIISGSNDYTIKVWDVSTGNKIMEIHNDKIVKKFYITSDDMNIISISENDAKIKIWDIATGHLIETLNDNASGVLSAIILVRRHNKLTSSLKKFL